MKKIRALKGTTDILPADIAVWHEIETVVADTMRRYGYGEIRPPVFEETALFARSIGEDTDIVGKEMYTFTDMGGRSLTLRPELTASVIRAFIEHSLDQQGLPQKLWYTGPLFRQERPQKGRQRQFHQFGVEMVGSASPLADAEVMILFDDIAAGLGLSERMYSLNAIGGAESRDRYRTVLVDFLDSVADRLCDNCRRRKETNPLRVLDCKNPGCREAVHDSDNLPRTVDYLTDPDRSHYDRLKTLLDASRVRYTEDPYLVRGLDYYTGAVFEMNISTLGAQSAVMGGGRYDNLVSQLGGPDTPAVGFACGMERLILSIAGERAVPVPDGIDVFLVTFDDDGRRRALGYLQTLRARGFSADTDFMERSMKAQMKASARAGARFTLIVEPKDGMVSVRDMRASEQETKAFDDFLAELEQPQR